MKAIFTKLYHGQSLAIEESEKLFCEVAEGKLTHAQLAGALVAMKMRGETPEEMAGAAKAFLQYVRPFSRPDYVYADIVGTGGDEAGTINVSTASAIVAASCGLKIAKHGNRSVSSLTGSSDLLAELGVKLMMKPEESRQMLDEHNICFLFAPYYNEAFKFAAPVRNELGTRTLFNVLGPLVNPTRPPRALIGVYSEALVKPIAETAKLVGFEHVIVVHGGGIDEVALHAPTKVAELYKNEVTTYHVTPEDFGLNSHPLSALIGGNPKVNREAFIKILQGKAPEAHNHAVAINVAMLLKLFGEPDLKENAQTALKAIASGQALALVNAISHMT